jgi:broad specificity phosphatase PhoE
MIESHIQHLVIVRHGEGEGDVRRAARKANKEFITDKTVDQEELTLSGEEQSNLAGLWIMENIIARYGLARFSGCYVSPTYRTEQSAAALNISDVIWQIDKNLFERNRGLIAGWPKVKHREAYPKNYNQMLSDPVNWVPPAGESIKQVVGRVEHFLSDIDDARAALVVTHRDWIWASQQPLDGLNDEELALVDTDTIENSQIIHYTCIDPISGAQSPYLMWKRSVSPWVNDTILAQSTEAWIRLRQ